MQTAPSWKDIASALDATPPHGSDHDARIEILQAIDAKLISRLESYDPDLVELYHARVDTALLRLDQSPPAAGLEVIKLYSSSVVLRTASETILMDFCQGPIDNRSEPEGAPEAAHQFYWTPRQRERLADAVDGLLISHEHHDHADHSLARLLTRAGKPVVGPRSLQRFWAGTELAETLETAAYGATRRIGRAVIHSFRGAQYSGFRERERPSPLPPPRPEGTEHAVYVVEIGGRCVVHAGDNWIALDGWLAELAANGVIPDIVLGLGMADCPLSIQRSVSGAAYIPVHDLELKHSGGGSRLSRHFHEWRESAEIPERRAPLVLFWGEHVRLSPAAGSADDL